VRSIQKIIQVTNPADGEREEGREPDSQPDAREHVAPADLDDVRDQDSDDERGFEALAQADEKVCEHGSFPGGSNRGDW
jgi:hypothetical protein